MTILPDSIRLHRFAKLFISVQTAGASMGRIREKDSPNLSDMSESQRNLKGACSGWLGIGINSASFAPGHGG